MDAKEILSLAYLAALKSPDPRTQVGAVLVTQTGALIRGYNTPFGDYDKGRYFSDRDYRLSITIHAELCTILNAAAVGERAEGATLYAPWSACRGCASALIGAGIRKLVRHDDVMDHVESTYPHWVEQIAESDDALESAGIVIREIKGPIQADPIRIDGKEYDPAW